MAKDVKNLEGSKTWTVAGPAYTSRAVEAGDSLLKVDGEKATPENFQHLLIGCDVPVAMSL